MDEEKVFILEAEFPNTSDFRVSCECSERDDIEVLEESGDPMRNKYEFQCESCGNEGELVRYRYGKEPTTRGDLIFEMLN